MIDLFSILLFGTLTFTAPLPATPIPQPAETIAEPTKQEINGWNESLSTQVD